jgi:hypothetical protein
VQERIVRRSKLDWVIVRPVILTNRPKTNDAYRVLVDRAASGNFMQNSNSWPEKSSLLECLLLFYEFLVSRAPPRRADGTL